MEYSKLASGKVTGVTGGIIPVNLPFIPNVVELNNFTASTTPASGGVVRTYWTSDMAQASAIQYVFNATPVLTTQTTTTGGISTFSAGAPLLGSTQQIVSITKANPAVVTVTSHGYSTGDVVIMTGLFQSTTTGMPQIASMPFVITVTGTDTFTIPWNTNQSNYTALSGSPTGALVRKVLYPYLYFPGVKVISAITTGSTTTIDTTSNHNLVVGNEVAFSISSPWGTTQLSGTSSSIANYGQELTGYVTAVNSATEVVVGIDTSSGYTAFNSNPTVAQAIAGLTPPQMRTIGDNNTGSATNAYLPTTINGPSIGGAFQNNTRQGFIIGNTSSGTTSDVILWTAYAMDYPT
ncbi:MAG TPA: hypothetical protein VFX43_09390 [Chitinophagaceae bacterium]|nr:hypothetical protein [Chitinophagaceae bacterium]